MGGVGARMASREPIRGTMDLPRLGVLGFAGAGWFERLTPRDHLDCRIHRSGLLRPTHLMSEATRSHNRPWRLRVRCWIGGV